MESISVIFAMLIAILLSGVIVRVLPIPIPLPLIQIALGILITAIAQEGIVLNPDVFFFIFLPPLLFLDGWRIPKDALQKDRLAVFQLAFGLVIITVLCLGYLIHWLIPALPLAVSFALAAILSPTDPVAVAGIARKLAVPHRIMTILEGEALFNDASGLVTFRVAVLATVTGTFSFSKTISSFLWVALAGILVGICVTWILTFLRTKFRNIYGEEVGSEVLISLLTPFAAYVAAEQIGGSGILSAVSAGITMSFLELSGKVSPVVRMRRTAVWDTIQFTLNGIMFVLLGEQLPVIFKGAVHIVSQTGHHSPWWLIVYALVICLSLAALRFIWVFLSLHLFNIIRHRSFALRNPIRLRDILIVSFGGVRGAVTLAGVMTLPLLLPDGSAFPGRELAIFLAATVIILSLIAASIILPLLLKNVAVDQTSQSSFDSQKQFAVLQARTAAQQHLDQLIARKANDENNDPSELQERARILLAEFLTSFSGANAEHQDAHNSYEAERTMRLAILEVARQTTYRLARDHKISDEVARDIVKQLDFDQMRYD